MKMLFRYDELKECVEDDFNRFYEMGFSGNQIFPAVLNEYEHGEDFNQVENVCIHIFLISNYMGKNLDYSEILEKVNLLITGELKKEIEVCLGNDYSKFVSDLGAINN